MKLWLDDVREMPSGYKFHAKTVDEAIDLLKNEQITFISFDYDLGDDNGTGYEVAQYIEEMAFKGIMHHIGWNIHSQNPVGAENIRKAMEKAETYWLQTEKYDTDDEECNHGRKYNKEN